MLKKSKTSFSERHAGSRRRFAAAASKLRLAFRRARSLVRARDSRPLFGFLVENYSDFCLFHHISQTIIYFSGPYLKAF
jgi:hypothetical protein